MEIALRLRVGKAEQLELLFRTSCQRGQRKVVSFLFFAQPSIEIGVSVLDRNGVCRRNGVEYIHRIGRCNHFVATFGIGYHIGKAIAYGNARNRRTGIGLNRTGNFDLCRSGQKNRRCQNGEKQILFHYGIVLVYVIRSKMPRRHPLSRRRSIPRHPP